MTRTTAFGLDIRADRALPFLQGGSTRATGRRLDLMTRRHAEQLDWPRVADLISDERDRSGAVVFQIERAPVGYRIVGPRYGSAIVASDGGAIIAAPGSGGGAAWQRLLIAQALPFAAALRGLEVFHASAVAIDGEAVALLGRSGAGKTSVAMALAAHGAAFLTDDVLSIEPIDGRLLAHCGPPFAGVATSESERLRKLGRLPAERVIAEDQREVILRISPRADPTPLRAMFILDRRADGPRSPHFEPLSDARELLSATFNLLLLEPGRLRSLLDVCALAAAGHVERARVGPATDATALAAAVLERIAGRR